LAILRRSISRNLNGVDRAKHNLKLSIYRAPHLDSSVWPQMALTRLRLHSVVIDYRDVNNVDADTPPH
jgi:hypothetical protein